MKTKLHLPMNIQRQTLKLPACILSAIALLCAASAPAETVYDFVPTSPPAPDSIAASITINNSDVITAASFTDSTVGAQDVTYRAGGVHVTIDGSTILFDEIDLYHDAIFPETVKLDDNGITDYDDGGVVVAGSFVTSGSPPPTSAPDTMATWAAMISTCGGLLFFHRRVVLIVARKQFSAI